MEYQRRIIDDELDDLFRAVPAIAIDGPKAVGKTTTAQQRAVSTLRLDSDSSRAAVAAEPAILLRHDRPVLLDEWQRVPAVWDVVRRAVDQDASGGQFLLTGSATPAEDATAHSGAGRIGRLRMRPMTLGERGAARPSVSLADLLSGQRDPVGGETDMRLADYANEIEASGFPALRPLPPRARRFQLDSYLSNIVDRDVAEQGLSVRKPQVMLDWLRAYAAATATTANYTTILDAATPGLAEKPARPTVVSYRDALTRLWIVDPVPAWSPMGSPLTRLQQSPKHHLADPALAARLLGVGTEALLDGRGRSIGGWQGTLLGQLFESLAALCVRVAAQAAEASVGHLRTRNGDHEIDLVVARADGRALAIEVKLAGSVEDRDVRHLNWLQGSLGDDLLDRAVLTTGPVAYRRPDGVAVIPLALLGP